MCAVTALRVEVRRRQPAGPAKMAWFKRGRNNALDARASACCRWNSGEKRMYCMTHNQYASPWPRSFARRFVIASLLLGLMASASRAGVSFVGDVLPADDRFTLNTYEGLPLAGNKV